MSKDIIYREDAIKAIKEYHFFINNQCKYPSEGCVEVIEDAINVPSVDRPQGEWIPCSKKLPSEFSNNERVLATTDVDGLGVILMPIYDIRSWYLKGYISAWMPLPQPWKGETNETDY